MIYHLSSFNLRIGYMQNEKNILRRVVRAVNQNDTLLAFQPIVKSVEPNSVFCFEGLVRIREASGQIIPASKFMPLS